MLIVHNNIFDELYIFFYNEEGYINVTIGYNDGSFSYNFHAATQDLDRLRRLWGDSIIHDSIEEDTIPHYNEE